MTAERDTLPLLPLAPEMQAVMDRLMAEDGVQPDPTLLPPAEGRARAEAANRRWNGPAPAMARELIVETPGGRRAFVFIPRPIRAARPSSTFTAAAGPSAQRRPMRAQPGGWLWQRGRLSSPSITGWRPSIPIRQDWRIACPSGPSASMSFPAGAGLCPATAPGQIWRWR